MTPDDAPTVPLGEVKQRAEAVLQRIEAAAAELRAILRDVPPVRVPWAVPDGDGGGEA